MASSLTRGSELELGGGVYVLEGGIGLGFRVQDLGFKLRCSAPVS